MADAEDTGTKQLGYPAGLRWERALFGNGIAWVGPITNFSPLYSERTIELCHGADPICSPADPKTWEGNWPDHAARAYINAGMVNQAADFIVGRI